MVDSRQEGTLTGILDAAKTTTMLCPSNCRSRPIQENHGLTVVNLSATKRPQVTRERCGPRDTRRQRTADPGGGGGGEDGFFQVSSRNDTGTYRIFSGMLEITLDL